MRDVIERLRLERRVALIIMAVWLLIVAFAHLALEYLGRSGA